MKTFLLSIFIACAFSASAQTGRKDTIKLDSTHVEKIKKMPMDTALHNMPVVPVQPPEQPKKDTTQNRKKSPAQKKQPVH